MSLEATTSAFDAIAWESKGLLGIHTDIGSLVDNEAHLQMVTGSAEEKCSRP
jgi:hypothetical protein